MQTDKEIRIAYLVSQYPAVNHTFILREIRGLRKLGAELRVASISDADRPPEKMTADEREEAANTYFVKSAGLLNVAGDHLATFVANPAGYFRGLVCALSLGQFHPKRTLSALFYFAEAVIVGRWMQHQGLSHFHTHFSSTVGLIMQRIFPVTMSMTIHGPGEFDDPAGFRLSEKIAASSFVCAISNYGRSQLMKVSDYSEWNKIEVSPLGIDPAVFTTRPFREAPETFEVICVGRLAPVKAQHILVAAIDRLRKQGRRVRLRLIGDGPDRRGLEQNVSARRLNHDVIFEGWCNQDQVLALYEQADAFALASFAEGVPVVLMEAMAMEIPCVATRITGVPELIRDGVDGLLIAPSSVEELAEAIATLMDDPELRRRLGSAGRERVMEKYDLAHNTAQLANIMRCRMAQADFGKIAVAQPITQPEARVEAVGLSTHREKNLLQKQKSI